tara:strand:- start:3219 stop:4226 length:1008 start_codon:yes stop_codon:yes gene_type:complete
LNKSHIIIIAEAGVNHNGSIPMAKEMIDVAADAGADLVKFQTFTAEKLVIKTAKKADYQKNSSDQTESQFQMIKKLELSRNDHEILLEHCNKNNIQFLSTPFDRQSINLLDEINIPFFKIPSGEITNLPYLRHIGGIGKPVVISTGMATISEVKNAMSILLDAGIKQNDITVLHCNSEYPSPMKDVNLKAMQTLENELGVKVGYSDHTLGIEVSVAAVAMGAKVIEKHFTLDRNLYGPDHGASLEPSELKEMISAIRNIERALGDGVKKPSQSEIKNLLISRKSIVSKRPIKKGELFSKENLTVKRPGNGISPMKWDEILGSVSIRDYLKDELIQ